MDSILQQIREAVGHIRTVTDTKPSVGIVLGSGLGNFASQIRVETEIEYDVIPHFPVSTVQGHHGKLIFGYIAGKPVVAMKGRFHFYEGYSAAQVVFPIRVMKMLGVQTLLISNAAGGVNPEFRVGDLMIIRDHIHLSTVNPLIGPNIEELGPRFPDMTETYNKRLIARALHLADSSGIEVKQGVYYGVTGPTFETKAEYRMIHLLGGDAVGMSTVQEVIAARHMGLDVFAMSIITDIGLREEDNVITHEEVLQAAQAAEPKLTKIFTGLIESL